MENGQSKQAATVMIVDDELFFRGLLRDILTKDGLQVVAEAANGAEAVALYREHSPAIVLMDIYMPEKNGIEATVEIIALDPNARILICSGVGYDQDLEAALQQGARGVIYKPFFDEEVLDVVRKNLAS
jgi:two-component system chemotaxis response regulator CheY